MQADCPPDEMFAVRRGRRTTIFRASGLNPVGCLDYINPKRPGELHTLFARAERAGNGDAAAVRNELIGELEWGVGGIMQRVEFDLGEGGALVTVPVEHGAHLRARWNEDASGGDFQAWEQATVEASMCPGGIGQRKDLARTSPRFVLAGAGASAGFLVPPYAYAVRVLPETQTPLGSTGWSLRIFAGDDTGTNQIQSVNSTPGTTSVGWGPTAVWGGGVVLAGGARFVEMLQGPNDTQAFRLQFLLRL